MQRVRVSSHQTPVHKLGQTQITLSPKFKVASTSPSSLDQLTSLIPNLPDDIALNCLLRTPVSTHISCRLVCKRWSIFFSKTGDFFALRKKIGLRNPYLFTFAFDRCTSKLHWVVLDLANFSWFRLPPMPCRATMCPHSFSCVPLSDTLLVCGGIVSDVDCPMHLVLKYELLKHKWSTTTRMHTPRSFFASGVIDGKVYVAGGYSTDQFELDSCEAFDPVEKSWTRVRNMRAKMACYDSCVVGGKLHVTEGWTWPFVASPIGQVYDRRKEVWEEMKVGMREGWVGPSVVVYGRVFVVSEREGMRVKVYNEEVDEWERVEGLPVPKRIRNPFVVCGDGWRIYVVGSGMRVVVGCVEVLDGDDGKRRFGVRWEEVEDPVLMGLKELTPSKAMVLFG